MEDDLFSIVISFFVVVVFRDGCGVSTKAVQTLSTFITCGMVAKHILTKLR